MRLFILICCGILIFGCETSVENTSESSSKFVQFKHAPAKKLANHELETSANKELRETNKNTSEYKIENRLPSQFYVSGPLEIEPGNTYSFNVRTRLKDTIETIVYQVETPLVFVDEITNIETPIISDELLASLSDALVKSNREDLVSYKKNREVQSIGKFSVVDVHETYSLDASSNWEKHDIDLKSITKPGLYLVEVRIGPQAAYLVVSANTISAVVRKFDERTLVWLTDNSGKSVANIPLFYEGIDGQSLQKLTNKNGVAVVSCYSPWILAWQKSQLVVLSNPQKNNHGLALWFDKESYAPGETVHIAWKHSLPPKSQIKFIAQDGYEALRKEISPQRSADIVLPRDMIPGKYSVHLGEVHKEITIVNASSSQNWQMKMITDRYTYRTGDLINLMIYGVEEREIKIDIYKEDTLVDRQMEVSSGGSVHCHLQLNEEGHYTIKSGEASTQIFVGEQVFFVADAIPEKPAFSDTQAKILLPKSEQSTLYILEGKNSSYHVQTPQNKGMWKDFSVNSGKWNAYAFSSGKLRGAFEFYVNGTIDVSLPQEIRAEEQIDLNVNIANSENYKYIAWATSGTNPIQIPSEDKQIVVSDSQNLPYLYEKWVREKIKTNYALAVVALGKKQYASTVYLCQKILQWAPLHKEAQNLLQRSIRNMQENNSDYLSPKERLKYAYVGELSPRMTFQELIEKIQEQANVYIEVDPKVYEKYPVETFTIRGLPSGENAFSLLSYFFTTRGLAYKIQYGVFFITLKSQNVLSDLIDELDKNVDTEMVELTAHIKEETKQPVFQTAFWTGWKSGVKTVSFPYSGMWNLYAIVVDEQDNHYLFAKQVWVADKLP